MLDHGNTWFWVYVFLVEPENLWTFWTVTEWYFNENSRTQVCIAMDSCVSGSSFPCFCLLCLVMAQLTSPSLDPESLRVFGSVVEPDMRCGVWTLWNCLEASWPGVWMKGGHLASSGSSVCWQSIRNDSCMWWQRITVTVLVGRWLSLCWVYQRQVLPRKALCVPCQSWRP